MYKIITTSGKELGAVDRPTYIYIQKNGTYGLCSEAEAQGVAYHNTPYQLQGRTNMERGLTEASIYEVDTGEVFDEQKRVGTQNMANIAYISMMSGIDISDGDADSEPGIQTMSVKTSRIMGESAHSKHYAIVKSYYDNGYWNAQMVKNAVDKWISTDEAEQILSGKVSIEE